MPKTVNVDHINSNGSVHSASDNIKVIMATSYEYQFKAELYGKYAISKKVFIPKEEYCKMIDDLKTAAAKTPAKSRDEYYLIAK